MPARRSAGRSKGGDRFAPAAAWLSKEVHLTAFGRALTDYTVLDLARPVIAGSALAGVVSRIDRFGNIITNLDRRSCEKLTEGVGVLRLTVGTHTIDRIVSTYAEIGPDEIAGLFGSTDRLECAMRAQHAADRLGVRVGDPVELVRV